jgi:hypothetical protein
MVTNKQEMASAYYMSLIDQEHVVESYSYAKSTLELKSRLLFNPLGFTLRDELDLHRSVLTFATACISHITTLQKKAGLGKLDFPNYHDFLRMFRDFNHHEHYLSFGPTRASIAGEKEEIDFFVFSTLGQIPALKKKYPGWVKHFRSLTLSRLLDLNYQYVLNQSQSALNKKYSGISFKVSGEQRMGILHIGESNRLDWENELGV